MKGDGLSVARNLKTVVSDYIEPEHYLGTSVDGAGFKSHVGTHLDEGHHDWDGVHAAATVDTALRNPKESWAKEFEWLNKMTSDISKANKFINWVMEWDRFF